jgi:hypothetical protein
MKIYMLLMLMSVFVGVSWLPTRHTAKARGSASRDSRAA